MTSYRQLELEHEVLKERVAELEETCATKRPVADSTQGSGVECKQDCGRSAVSSSDMYTQLANSSDWSARQMGAIEGTLAGITNWARYCM